MKTSEILILGGIIVGIFALKKANVAGISAAFIPTKIYSTFNAISRNSVKTDIINISDVLFSGKKFEGKFVALTNYLDKYGIPYKTYGTPEERLGEINHSGMYKLLQGLNNEKDLGIVIR